jgi:hypothetical protein
LRLRAGCAGRPAKPEKIREEALPHRGTTASARQRPD